ncbi:MAG TPA: ABC transporter ATP-binding protein [Roseiarcus sp.]|nr:ABC transporter ATP-binding protein [Roseiarcus sp.]
MGKTPALALNGVSKAYGAVRALSDLSFEVAEGRFFALFGPSSVGKTTTLRAVAGLTQPDSGVIRIDGADVTRAPIRGRGVSMVFQSFALYPHLTVAQNLAYPLVEEGVSRADIEGRVREIARMLRLDHRLDRKPATLSGGEQQRVALGRSLIRHPKLLLLDEPLTNLDAKLRHDMRAELKRLHRQFGMTIIYATPDELEALSMGDEIAVMRDGRVVQQGTPDELYEQPADLYVAAKIGSPHMNFIEVKVTAGGERLETPFGPLAAPRTARALEPGEQLVLGVRPADLRLAQGSRADLTPSVQQLEPLGDVTIVSLATGGQSLRIVLPESQALGFKPGDALPLALDSSKFHLFNQRNGSALARGTLS